MLGLAMGLMLAAATAQDLGAATNDMDALRSTLEIVDTVAEMDDFKPAGWLETGRLARAAQAQHSITLSGGAAFEIYGVCDADCTGLKLALLDSGGKILVDDEDSETPILDYAVPGTYTLRVTMVGCGKPACNYGVKSYRK
ncbi:MAG: hypothetical protein KF730_10535 [Sphingomonas sp.]|uniref:hypothetical protein n=1 Tax=Sphingomonas sp. TaxID=28214 RepID=UPI0025CE0BBE|nr:hypothetical protein [Sphingomonas sp.]MBX3565000.1 hypothetical protein [Sphingomonas sp.]